MLALIFSPVYTSAQDNYETQVYGYDSPPGQTMVELHSNFTRSVGKQVPPELTPGSSDYPGFDIVSLFSTRQ
jgi:hypothetical protein